MRFTQALRLDVRDMWVVVFVGFMVYVAISAFGGESITLVLSELGSLIFVTCIPGRPRPV